MDRLHICKPATQSYVFALLLALAAYPLHALAQPRPASVTVEVDRTVTSAPAGPISLVYAIEGEDAAAMADHGRNSTSTSMWGNRPCCGHGTGGAGFLNAYSSWEEQLRVLTPDVALGEYVVVDFSIGLRGHMERTQTYWVHTAAQVRYSMGLNFHGTWITRPSLVIDSPSDLDFSLDVGEIQEGAFKVKNGQWFNLISTLSVSVEGDFSGPWDQSFDVQSTFASRWLGGHVELLDGTPVSEFLIESESGFDYDHTAPPIPEPGTIALFLPGLIGVLLARRRSRADA
jgi:hypothetical protein